MSQTKNASVKLLGLLVAVQVPATVEYRDSICGENATLDEANSNDLYRGYASKWRTEFFKRCADAGLVPGEKEKDKVAVDRWIAEGLTSQNALQTIADETTDALPFIEWLSTSGQRASIGKSYVESATAIVSSWGKPHPDNPSIVCSAERTAASLATLLPGFTFSDDPDATEVAFALRDFQKAQEAQARKALL